MSEHPFEPGNPRSGPTGGRGDPQGISTVGSSSPPSGPVVAGLLDAQSKARRVLVIDDDRDIATALGLRLRAAGYSVSFAANGKAGLDLAAQTQPHAIVLDLRLPVMDGMAVLRELRLGPQPLSIPVVVLSASAVDQKKALDRGANLFIAKPFDAGSLVHAVHTVIGQSTPGKTGES